MNRTLLPLLLLALGALQSTAQAANLLVNPGFEADYTGWVTTGGPDLRSANPAPFEGTKYAFAIANAHFTLQQDVDLLAAGFLAADIDGGTLLARFGGWQAGFETQTDEGQIRLYFLDGSDNELGLESLPYFHSNMTWTEQSGSAMLLPGTRSLRFFFDGVRHDGSNNDAYLDAAYLEVAPVPLPAGLPLALSALASLGLVAGRARRRSPARPVHA